MEKNFMVEKNSKKVYYTGCQCFGDCDCFKDYPKTELFSTIKVFHKNLILEKQIPYNPVYSPGYLRSIIQGMVDHYEARIKSGKPLGINVTIRETEE